MQLKHKAIQTQLKIKSISDEGIFSGYASVTGIKDYDGDIVVKGAFGDVNASDIKMLWQHRRDEPIGVFTKAIEDDKGLYVEGKLVLESLRGKEAFALLKAGAVGNMSIGYRVLDGDFEKSTGDYYIKALDVKEISIVTFPANEHATVDDVKCTKLPTNSVDNNPTNKIKEGRMPDKVKDLDNVHAAFAEYKKSNDERIVALEKKGSVDPLTENKTKALSDKIQELQDSNHKLKSDKLELEKKYARPNNPGLGNQGGGEDTEYVKSYNNYLRTGDASSLVEHQKQYMSVGSDPKGGFSVLPTISKQIITDLKEDVSMRKLASVITIDSDAYEYPIDLSEVDAKWATETQSRDETGTPEMMTGRIPVHEEYAQPKVTDKLLEDSAINIGAYIGGKVKETFEYKENSAFLNGNGTTRPRGILTYDDGTDWQKIQRVAAGSTSAITADKLLQLSMTLKAKYAKRGSFLLNRTTLLAIMQLKDGNGQYIWQPGLAGKIEDTILGRPVVQDDVMPDIAANALGVVFADFKAAYLVIDRKGIRVLRDELTEKPFIKFYTTKRVGGDVVNFEAAKILEFKA